VTRDTQSFWLAVIVLVGSGLLLRFPPPGVDFTVMVAFIGPIAGGVVQHYFSQRTATTTTENIARAAPTTVVTENTEVTGSPVNVEPQGDREG
jgi:hypothetical protein